MGFLLQTDAIKILIGISRSLTVSSFRDTGDDSVLNIFGQLNQMKVFGTWLLTGMYPW